MAKIEELEPGKKYRIRAQRRVRGRRIGRAETVYGSRRQAERRLRQLEAELAEAQEAGRVPARERLDSYLRRWIEDVVSLRVKRPENAWKNYGYVCERYIIPRLGHIPLGMLNAAHIEEFIRLMVEDYGHGREVVYKAFSVLRSALNDAVEADLIPANPTQRVRSKPKPSNRRRETFSVDEFERFLRTARARTRYANLFELLARVALRPSEARGLRWEDVDFERRVLHVRRGLPTGATLDSKDATKTEGSERTLPLSDAALRCLERQRAQIAKERAEAGRAWKEHGLVFPSSVGTPFPERRVLASFRGCLRAAGLPERYTLYSLRHFFPTVALEAGSNIRAVADVMGHSRAEYTLTRYAHALDREQRRTMEALDKAVPGVEDL